MEREIFIGYDPREAPAYAVCEHSINRQSSGLETFALRLDELRATGAYYRPTSEKDGRLWDDISEAPMATEFAINRFLVPHLCGYEGWAVFMDCDILARADLNELFELADPSKAVMCVKHRHEPPEGVKMDGQAQTLYARKNWSSVMLFNCAHPSNRKLDRDLVNTVPGRDLHRFCWLEDDEIGELGPEWNWLAYHSDETIDPKLVHYTEGYPLMPGYESQPYAAEWRAELVEMMQSVVEG